MGSQALGPPLENEQLLSLCRVYGDSFGTLKFFVSVPSAPVYREYSLSAQPLEHGSFSKVGYEAALENPDHESNKSTPRQQPQNPPSVISQPISQPQRHTTIDRRPSSPRLGLSEQGPPPPQPSMLWSQRKDDMYGYAIRPLPITPTQPPAPLPLPHNSPSFSVHDEESIGLSVPHQQLHARTSSDIAALEATDHLSDTLVRSYSVREGPSLGKLKVEPLQDNTPRGSSFAQDLPFQAPPENIHDDLEMLFPKHDLDKPVIEASSGDTSPTTLEPAAVVPPPVTHVNDRVRIRGKKSIGIITQEHKRRIDRTSKAANTTSYANNMLRKRNTKLWGTRLEEVTTLQARNTSSSNLPDSPSGDPTTFKWVRGELIGEGIYGQVYLALNATTGEMIAVKQVKLPHTASDMSNSRRYIAQALKSESKLLKDLDHPNIVQYLGFEETPASLSM